MLSITLTGTPQAIIDSENGVFLYPDEFMYGFGDTSPIRGAKWSYDREKPFDYNGSYGKLWIEKEV